MITPKRLQLLKKSALEGGGFWEDFWGDLLGRHRLRNTDLLDLEESVREHAIGNFWGMLCSRLVTSGLLT